MPPLFDGFDEDDPPFLPEGDDEAPRLAVIGTEWVANAVAAQGDMRTLAGVYRGEASCWGRAPRGGGVAGHGVRRRGWEIPRVSGVFSWCIGGWLALVAQLKAPVAQSSSATCPQICLNSRIRVILTSRCADLKRKGNSALPDFRSTFQECDSLTKETTPFRVDSASRTEQKPVFPRRDLRQSGSTELKFGDTSRELDLSLALVRWRAQLHATKSRKKLQS